MNAPLIYKQAIDPNYLMNAGKQRLSSISDLLAHLKKQRPYVSGMSFDNAYDYFMRKDHLRDMLSRTMKQFKSMGGMTADAKALQNIEQLRGKLPKLISGYNALNSTAVKPDNIITQLHKALA